MDYNIHTIIPGEIRTFTGVMFNVFNPKAEQILIEDIAHSLSQQCRFTGHTSKFYSVAEHSLKCAEIVDDRHKLAALLHDASEAYMVDLPSPIKIVIPDFINIEDNLLRVISEKFGFEYPFHKDIKIADKTWLDLEWENLMAEDNWTTLNPSEAKELFIDTFNKLTNQ